MTMSKWSKKSLSLILAVCFAVAPILVSRSWADDIADKKAELNEIQSQMQDMQAKKEAARERAEAASGQLSEVTASLNELQAQTNALQAKSNALQGVINENQAKLEAKKAEVEERMRIYRKRLRDIYINGQINYLDVLLGAKDFGDFSSRMYLLQKIIASDLSMLDQLKKDAEEINARQAELDAQMRDIKATQSELEEKKARVEKLRQERAAVLYKAQEEEASSQSEYERLLAISENIAAMLRNMESGPASAGGTGQFMWPCNGVITSYFGWRTHPVFGTTRYHSGMDIGVDYGTPIHAADSGTVIYSGWMGGYGNLIMIDHGGGLVTLYGHNDSLAVGEGQVVGKGQVVAYAGSTGYSTGPHCHFEVRLHGEVTEPLNYLP